LSGGRPDAPVRPAAVGVGARIHGVLQDLADAPHGRASPLEVPTVGPFKRADPQADVVAHEVVKDPTGGADLVVLVENEAYDLAHLLVGVHRDPLRGELDIPPGHVLKELASLGLVQPSPLKAISHSY